MLRGLVKFWMLSRLFGRKGVSRRRGGCGLRVGWLLLILVLLVLFFLIRGYEGSNTPATIF